MTSSQRWRPILFSCPRTGNMVQALLAEEVVSTAARPEGAGTRYETVACLACSSTHLVNPLDGKVLGQ